MCVFECVCVCVCVQGKLVGVEAKIAAADTATQKYSARFDEASRTVRAWLW